MTPLASWAFVVGLSLVVWIVASVAVSTWMHLSAQRRERGRLDPDILERLRERERGTR